MEVISIPKHLTHVSNVNPYFVQTERTTKMSHSFSVTLAQQHELKAYISLSKQLIYAPKVFKAFQSVPKIHCPFTVLMVLQVKVSKSGAIVKDHNIPTQ